MTRRHTANDVFAAEESYAHIRPVGVRVVQPADSPAHRPHRCKVCKKPYANSSTARRHVQQVHPDSIRRGKHPADYVKLIEEETA